MLHLQYYLVATVLHAQSLRRQICAYIHIIHNIETLVGQKNLKKRESSECRVPFRVCAPLVRQPCRRASGSAQVFIVLVGLCRNEDFISCSVGSDVSNTRSAELCDVAGSRFDMCVCVCVCVYIFIRSFSSLSYDRSKASSKANSLHSAIQSVLFQMRVSSPFLKVIQ